MTRDTDRPPAVLWIAWEADDAEHRAALCRRHREDVFDRHPETARGLRRAGDRCSMCREAGGRQPEADCQAVTPSGEP